MRAIRVVCVLCKSRGSVRNKVRVNINLRQRYLCRTCAAAVAAEWRDRGSVPRSGDAG